MSELVPCPFCGGEGKLTYFGDGTGGQLVAVTCVYGCEAAGPSFYYDPGGRTQEQAESEAADAWNHREKEDEA